MFILVFSFPVVVFLKKSSSPVSGKQEVLQVYAGWRHALRNLKLPEKGFFFFTSGVSLGFPPQDSHRRHFQLRRTFVNISAGEETFFFCFCLFVETFSSVYLFPRRLNLKHRSVCVCVCEACRFTSTHILCALAETTLSNRGDVQLVSGSFWL